MRKRQGWWVAVVIVVVALYGFSRIHHNSPSPSASATDTKAATTSCYTAAQSWNEIGNSGCVQFSVGYTFVSSAGNAYLDQDVNYTNGFGVWIPTGETFGSSATQEYANKTIRVTGTISSYEGAPQIEVTDASQITLAGSTSEIPIRLLHPASASLDWSGFTIAPTTCRVVTPTQLQVTGSVIVPLLSGRGNVSGEVEAWAVDDAGQITAGQPWQIPNASGQWQWTVDVSLGKVGTTVGCKVQGIDPSLDYNSPQ